MALGNTQDRYGAVAQFFHWSIVILVFTQFSLAFVFSDMPLGLEKIAIIVKHKAIGMTILILIILRLIWRWLDPPPPLPGTTKPFERWMAKSAHILLYVLIIALPLSGWLMSSAAKIPVSYFGIFNFPVLIEPDQEIVKLTKAIHYFLNITLGSILVLHIAAALRHHFILNDDILLRILPKLFDRKS